MTNRSKLLTTMLSPLHLLATTTPTPTSAPGHQTQPVQVALTVVVTGAEQAEGLIGAALYAAAEGFPNQRAKAAQLSARPRTAPVDSFVFRGKTPGRYAVSVYHDTNSNGKLDTNLFGAPKESWATTASVRPRLRALRFEGAMISVTTDTRTEIRLER